MSIFRLTPGREITEALISAALGAREKAYARYSGYKVGAALLCSDGTVVTGCNVENASYPAGCCAERSALFAAVSDGHRGFDALALCGGADAVSDYCLPCGICRQALAEFCGDELRIISARGTNDCRIYTLGELLPHAFRGGSLRKD